MNSVCDDKLDIQEYRKEIAYIFYRIGLVGIKVDPTSSFSWAHLSGVSVSTAEITENTKIQIHKTFWRVLGVSEMQAQL